MSPNLLLPSQVTESEFFFSMTNLKSCESCTGPLDTQTLWGGAAAGEEVATWGGRRDSAALQRSSAHSGPAILVPLAGVGDSRQREALY